MQILLSCAKTMAESTSLPIPRTTSPLYGAQAGELAGQLATLSTEELAKILRVNHRIAATNRLRYSRFHDDAERALPALHFSNDSKFQSLKLCGLFESIVAYFYQKCKFYFFTSPILS